MDIPAIAARIYSRIGWPALSRIGVAGVEEVQADIQAAIQGGTTDGLHDLIAGEMDRTDENDATLRAYVDAIAEALGYVNHMKTEGV